MSAERNLLDYRLEHIFSFTMKVDDQLIGPCPQGLRANAYILEGEVSGPKIRGKIRPMDGNWANLRPDGVAQIDYRLTFDTEDGAVICMTWTGVSDFGEDAYEKFSRREPLSRYRAHRVGLHCHTAHPNYLWLNRVHCLGIGQFDSQQHEVVYDVYTVR